MTHDFCRIILKDVFADVKRLVPLEIRKRAWTYSYPGWNDTREFHCPSPDGKDDFYFHKSACCNWMIRVDGWIAYLEKYYPRESKAMADRLAAAIDAETEAMNKKFKSL